MRNCSACGTGPLCRCTLEEILFFLAQTCVVLVHLVQPLFMVKFKNKLEKEKKYKKVIFFYFNFFSPNICTISQKCTEIVLENILVNFSSSTVCKGLLLVYASAFYDKAVIGIVHIFSIKYHKLIRMTSTVGRPYKVYPISLF